MEDADTDLKPIDELGGARILRLLRRRWYVIVICAVVAPAIAYYISAQKPKQYQSTAKLLFRESSTAASLTDAALTNPDRVAATNGDLLQLPEVAQRTSQALGGELTPGQISSRVTTGSTLDSDVYSVEATDHDPAMATRLANTYAERFVAVRRVARKTEISTTIRALRLRIDSTKDPKTDSARESLDALKNQLDDLLVAQQFDDGGVEVAQSATVPTSPTSPHPRKDAMIGLGLGLLLGLLLAGLLETLDPRLRSADNVAAVFTHPVLGTIPESRHLRQRGGHLEAGELEAFRMLRAHLLYFTDDRRLSTVLITSSNLSEGKSTVAWNLAVAAADAGVRTLLVEGDLRRPVFAERYGFDADQGLSDVLTGESTLDDAVVSVAIEHAEPVAGAHAHTLDVVFAGAPLYNPVEGLESGQADAFFTSAREQYDLVVVDSPPVTAVPDAIPLLHQVDGVVIVVRAGTATRPAAERLQSQLSNLGAHVAGIVINGSTPKEQNYGYGYPARQPSRRMWPRKRIPA